MNVDDFIKQNLNSFIDDYANDAIKLFPKNNIGKSKNVVIKEKEENEITMVNNNNDDDDDDDEYYSENGDEFYSKEDIYGCLSDDDDSIDCDDYKRLHTYMKNEKNIIPEIDEDYKEDEENFKYQVEEEYEKFHKH